MEGKWIYWKNRREDNKRKFLKFQNLFLLFWAFWGFKSFKTLIAWFDDEGRWGSDMKLFVVDALQKGENSTGFTNLSEFQRFLRIFFILILIHFLRNWQSANYVLPPFNLWFWQ